MGGRGLILGIETSCDETAAAVVERGSRTLSSVVASQIKTHARYGGVVPELASREHLRAIVPVVRAALAEAGVGLGDLDAIAVTAGPGLAGALLVGITYAKALAAAQGLPLIAVNHLEGHIHAVLLLGMETQPQDPSGAKAQVDFVASTAVMAKAMTYQSCPDTNQRISADEPALALVVSGGHTHLYLARLAQGAWSYRLMGRTVDDAAGEAFDKVAKLLGFGYPGGPWIDALARFGNPKAVPFAFAQIKTKAHLTGKVPRTKAAKTAPIANLDPRFMFSFSGIKTAVLRYVELHGLREEARARAARLFAPGAEARPPQNKEEALALCPQAGAGFGGQLPVRGGGRPDEEEFRGGGIAGGATDSGDRRSGRQPRTARALQRRGCAARGASGFSYAGDVDGQCGNDCCSGLGTVSGGGVCSGVRCLPIRRWRCENHLG